jgi:hypothetical protein
MNPLKEQESVGLFYDCPYVAGLCPDCIKAKLDEEKKHESQK